MRKLGNAIYVTHPERFLKAGKPYSTVEPMIDRTLIIQHRPITGEMQALGHGTLRLDRRQARLLAKRILQCLEES